MFTNQTIERIEKYGVLAFLGCLAAISLGLFLWEFDHWNWEKLQDFALNNSISPLEQKQILKEIFLSLLAIVPLSLAIAIRFPSGSTRTMLKTFLKILSIIFLIPFLLDKNLWRVAPFVVILMVSLLTLYVYHIIKKIELIHVHFSRINPIAFNIITYAILSLLILGYASYFSYYTILNHYHLGTAIYDLGTFQNAFVNTLHGHFMSVSFWEGELFFRDHCDFINLFFLPFFYLFPKTETFLILQSAVIALAALPLFLFCREILKSSFVALLIALLFLLNPENHTANFYDVHQLAFLPICSFTLFYFMEKKSTFGFILSLFLILSIKADMCLLLLFIALFIFFNNKKDQKFAVYCIIASVLYKILFGLVLKNWMLNSFFFYYEGIMLFKSGGIKEIFKTIVTNPVYILNTCLTSERILYFCQTFGPLAFIPLMRKRNFLLFLYGLAITLLATRLGLHEIYFQYVWYLVPFLFIGLIYLLKDVQTNNPSQAALWRTLRGNVFPILAAAVFATLIYSWQYGAILNKRNFRGGFHEIDFQFTAVDKKRLQTLNNMIARIPPNASIQASDPLCSHFLNQPNIQNFSDTNIRRPEYLLVMYYDRPDYVKFLIGQHIYTAIEKKDEFQLLKRN